MLIYAKCLTLEPFLNFSAAGDILSEKSRSVPFPTEIVSGYFGS